MKEIAIVGRPNSGKTMFAVNFAGFLGSRKLAITFRTYDSVITCRQYTLDEARGELCSLTEHKTRCLQSMLLKTSVGKATLHVKLTDTCGISERIHEEQSVRCGMAQTLSIIRYADFIVHIFDLSCFTADNKRHWHYRIDQEIYHYGAAYARYLLLANKIDLPDAKERLYQLHSLFPQVAIVPVSALHSQGFKEVKAHVVRNI